MHHMYAFLHGFMLQEDPTAGAGGSAAGAGIGIVAGIVYLAILILMIAAMWKVFEKAGEPGWAALVPIYNLIVLLKIAGKPAWWFILMLIPFVNVIVFFIVSIAVAERFGKGIGFGIGLAILPFVFYPLLAWGESHYGAAPQAA
jgi:uncharacterized membrane protein YhaH (DUF805 family)